MFSFAYLPVLAALLDKVLAAEDEPRPPSGGGA
jgi:hypothetical protein